jgi:hypothetical protein
MALQAESNRVSLRISEETLWAETPATPTMARLPYLSNTIGHSKRTKQSEVLRSDRMKDAQVQVGVSAEGDINFELRFADFAAILRCALASAFVAQSTTGAGTSNNFAFAAAGGGVQVITGPAAWTANYIVGAWVRIKLAANALNNGVFKITAKDSTTMTVANATGAAESASVAVIAQNTIRNGTTKRSLLIEKQYEDLTNNYISFRGMRVGRLSLSISTEQIVTGTVSFMGEQGYLGSATVSGSLTNASANDSMSASTNVGTVYENGVALATALKSLKIDLNNNLRSLAAIGHVAAIGVNMGSLQISGTIEAYYEDQILLAKVFSHASTSLSFLLTDPQGNTFVFTLAQLKASGNPNDPAIDQDVMLPLEFSGEKHSTDLYMIQIDALAA